MILFKEKICTIVSKTEKKIYRILAEISATAIKKEFRI